MAYAETVIVCNPYLKAYAEKVNEHTFTIPTVVLLDTYVDVMQKHTQRDDDSFVIGWIGSWTTGIYVLDIFPVMKKFVQKYDNVRFHLIGFDEKLLSEQEREEAHIEVITWSEAQEIEHILNFDIGIMPLADDEWSRGKCGFKLVQYMSCRKAVIASAVGINSILVKNNINGLLVNSEIAWFDAFEQLYLNNKLREEMAENNLKKIEKEYNNKIYSKYYIKLLQDISSKAKRMVKI
jgi:glycosyltransferase involved in cell wall biosynthesis